jgi:hypothetical protein
LGLGLALWAALASPACPKGGDEQPILNDSLAIAADTAGLPTTIASTMYDELDNNLSEIQSAKN